MSNVQEKYDDDADWLYLQADKIGKFPTEDQEEQFCERVSIRVISGGIKESDARRITFVEMFG